MKPTDITIKDVSFHYEDYQYRTPIKFGGVAVDRATILNVECAVESRDGRRAPKPARPTCSSAAPTRRASASPRTPRSRRPKATFSNTDRCGHSAPCRTTMPRLRLPGGTASIGSSSTRMRPVSGVMKPARRRSSVVLPEPAGPSSV